VLAERVKTEPTQDHVLISVCVVVLANALALSGHPKAVKSASRPGRALTVLEGGALSDFDNITVRIADVAARLAVLGYWLRDELGSSTFP
jgi:hypothetical protein